MKGSLLGVGALVFANSEAFLLQNGRHLPRKTEIAMVVPSEPVGSVSDAMPDDGGDDEASDETTNLDSEVSELLRRRKKPPRASRPSTINGVPTSEATGFGKPKEAATPAKPYVGIGPKDPQVNDPTNPEFDDQGYTLYTDNQTGKKSRVFEALVEYPCDFTMKIVGENESSFVDDIVAIVAEACETETSNLNYRTRAMGKWTSVTVQAPVKDSEMLYTLYEKVGLDPRVKFKF